MLLLKTELVQNGTHSIREVVAAVAHGEQEGAEQEHDPVNLGNDQCLLECVGLNNLSLLLRLHDLYIDEKCLQHLAVILHQAARIYFCGMTIRVNIRLKSIQFLSFGVLIVLVDIFEETGVAWIDY